MASDRIGKTSAKLVAMPPHTWTIERASWLLDQPTVKENLHAIPVNEPLVDNLLKEPLRNPFLCLPSWWPIVGGQRVKAISHIRENYNKNYNPELYICKINEEYHNIWYLWGDKTFRSKAIAITFQLWELVFKSLWYKHETTNDGVPMTYYEDLGEELEWDHNRLPEIKKIYE